MASLTIRELVTKWGFDVDKQAVTDFDSRLKSLKKTVRLIGISIAGASTGIGFFLREAGKMEKKKLIDRYHVDQLAYLLNRMQSIDEVDGTLLDNSMLVYGAGIGDGDRHNHDDLPILLCGKGGGRLPQGQHLRFPRHTPMNNLFVSLLDKVGVDVEQLGDSNGNLKELL